MKNKKILLIFAIMIVSMVVLAGCGSSTDDTQSAQPASTDQQTAAGETAAPASGTETSATGGGATLLDQVKNSGHAKLFPTMVSKGEAVKDPNGEGYGDGCIRCHSEVKIVDDPNAVLDDFFSGGKYADNTAGITCKVCHTLGGKDMVQLRNSGWDTCGSCHVNSSGDPKLGSAVHHPQYQMIKGVAIGDVMPEMPSLKYSMGGFACQDCHETNAQKHDFLVPGETVVHDAEGIARESATLDYEKFKEVFNQDKCKACHTDPQPVVDKLKAHQEEIGKVLEELRPVYDEWSKKVADMDPNDPKVIAFNNGMTFFTFVDADASKGAHNYEYAKKALELAKQYWSTLN